MCLIIGCPKGTDKKSKFLIDAIKVASETNTDGIGYSYKREGADKIFISKGYTRASEAIKSIKNKRLKNEDELMVHLRIGNRGAKSIAMTHPFVVSDNEDMIVTEEGYVKHPTLAHNGTFHNFSSFKSEKSDTYFFIKEFLAIPEILALLIRSRETFMRLFSATVITTNRLCLLFPNADMMCIGDFKEDEGYFFSNQSYKNSFYRNIGGVEEYAYPSQREPAHRGISEDNRVKQFLASTHHVGRTKQQLEIPGMKLQEASSKYDIIPPFGTSVIDSKSGLKLFKFGGFYIPIKFPITQFTASKIIPTEFNYKTMFFKTGLAHCTNDYGAKLDTYYRISGFDDKILTLSLLEETEQEGWVTKNNIYLTPENLIEDFEQILTPRTKELYDNVFKAHKHINFSKNQAGKLAKFIARDFNPRDVVLYKGTTYNCINALKIFYTYLCMAVYEDDYSKYIPTSIHKLNSPAFNVLVN